MKTQLIILALAFVSVNTFATKNEEALSANNALAESEMVESADMEFEIALEDWMLDLDNNTWVEQNEQTIELEEWMTTINDNSWNSTNEEKPLELEAWMLSTDNWLKE